MLSPSNPALSHREPNSSMTASSSLRKDEPGEDVEANEDMADREW